MIQLKQHDVNAADMTDCPWQWSSSQETCDFRNTSGHVEFIEAFMARHSMVRCKALGLLVPEGPGH